MGADWTLFRFGQFDLAFNDMLQAGTFAGQYHFHLQRSLAG